MDRLYLFSTFTPAGTPQNAPVSTPFPLEDAVIDRVRIIIPDGHVGVTGIRLLQSQQQVVPWANNQYLVGNDRVIDIPFDNEIGASGLQAQTYNTGINDHHHYVEIVVKDLPLNQQAANASQLTSLIVPSQLGPSSDPLGPDVLLASVADTPPIAEPVDLPVGVT